MTLQEQFEKVEKDLKKLEEKKKDLLEKRKQLLSKIELETAKREAQKGKKVLEIVEKNFGEITDEKLELFQQFLEAQIQETQVEKKAEGQEDSWMGNEV